MQTPPARSARLRAARQARSLGAREVDLLRSYPTLRAIDLAPAWAYLRAHPDEIEHQIRDNETQDHLHRDHRLPP